MPKTDGITQERLKELLHYDPWTGVFVWLVNRGGKKAGDIAGSKHIGNGYIFIGIDNMTYRSHRLAFLYVLGWMPEQVDHDNQIRHDNRWKNLNASTHADNQKNESLRCTNKSGHCGVSWDKRDKVWVSRIKVNKKAIHLGSFADKLDAIAARKAADIEYGFHTNHGKSSI